MKIGVVYEVEKNPRRNKKGKKMGAGILLDLKKEQKGGWRTTMVDCLELIL